MEPIVRSETSAIRTQTPGNCPKRNKLHLEHGENLKTRIIIISFLIVLFTRFIIDIKQGRTLSSLEKKK